MSMCVHTRLEDPKGLSTHTFHTYTCTYMSFALELGDLWGVIFDELHFSDVCAVRRVCKSWSAHCELHDRRIAHRYAVAVLGDGEFWKRARRRPIMTSKPLGSGHREIVRIETFRRACGESLKAEDLYAIWEILDAATDCADLQG